MKNKILVYGYGNPGRMDDGLGNAVIEQLEEWAENEGITNIDFDSNYQLNIEDADTISPYETVIFVDASEEPIEGFILTEVDSSDAKIEFTMHAVSTSYILDLCKKMYKKAPKTYLLHIKGYEWEFAEELSEQAKENLKNALDFLKNILKNPETIQDNLSKGTTGFWNN
ncbi:MAG: hydrogenase maturation protease [Bacteroidales bacterium]|nr:hydrogenase maturation protease [Bacteroidales bacterium]